MDSNVWIYEGVEHIAPKVHLYFATHTFICVFEIVVNMYSTIHRFVCLPCWLLARQLLVELGVGVTQYARP
jgi:hypothetical protein